MRGRIGRPSPALIVAIVALVAALSGTTWAAVNTAPVGSGGGASADGASATANTSATPAQRRAARRRAARRRKRNRVIPSRNTVGVRQLKRNAVVTGKIRNNAVSGAKIRNKSLTGADINLNQLGKVPEAEEADEADDAGSVDGHDADCPGGTTLIRGICFERSANSAAPDLMAASDSCAAKGGWLPTTMQLRSTRGILNLGTGAGDDHMFTDTVHANTAGGGYSTIVVDGAGNLIEQSIASPSKYICAFPLVR